MRCHPRQLNQVFMNLLLNSAHAIIDQGIIHIKTWYESGNINVAISDTGRGIAREHLSRVFEPFLPLRRLAKAQGWG